MKVIVTDTPLIVEDEEGNVLFEWQPKTRSQLTEKYFRRLHNLINNYK
jgi:hypothetical protein